MPTPKGPNSSELSGTRPIARGRCCSSRNCSCFRHNTPRILRGETRGNWWVNRTAKAKLAYVQRANKKDRSPLKPPHGLRQSLTSWYVPLSEQAVYGTADADENTSMIGTGAGAGTGTKVTVAPMLAVMGLEMFTVLLTTAFEIESPELPPVAVLLMLLVLSLMAELPLVLALLLPLVLPFTLVFVTGLTLHTTAPAVEFVPTPQGPQIVAPTTEEDVPAAQGVQ